MNRTDVVSRRRMDRRAFVQSLPAMAALMGGSARAAAAIDAASATTHDHACTVSPDREPLDNIGIQLYTLRSLLSNDLEGTLAAIAKIGYREVELAGMYGRSAAEMRASLDLAGLRAVASHHSLRDVRGSWNATLDAAATLGQSYVAVASIDRSERGTLDDYRRIADAFNGAGEAARGRGMQFGYHNHDFEFQPIDGIVPYDLLLERCDPALVIMEMDIFWAVNGGKDPLAYFTAHAGRFHLIHAKDRTAAGEMVNVGSGVIDFRAILARSQQAGIRYVFVEHDRPASPLDDVRASYTYLRGLS